MSIMSRSPICILSLILCWLVVGCAEPASPANSSTTELLAAPTIELKPSGSTDSTGEQAEAVELSVAAASDLKFALDEVLKVFGKQHPTIQVNATYGSSGNFFAQISNDAPFDVFLSADIAYPQKLVDQGHAFADTEFLYALGHLVVWVPQDSPLDVEQSGIKVLLDSRAKAVAIANPQHAPYGRAAVAALKELHVYEQVEGRLVLGENIAQTAQFVQTGAADVGIVALSLALAPAMKDKGRFWSIPSEAYPPLKQGGVILKRTRQEAAARTLTGFLQSKEGRSVLEQFGFELPGA